MYLMGIDVGTTGCKVIVFNLKGRIIARAYRSYDLQLPHAGWRELDPREVADAVFSCVRVCCQNNVGQQVAALSISAQGEALVPVDREGSALANSIVSFDTRNCEEVTWLRENIDLSYTIKKTGVPLHTMFSVAKLIWIKKHTPEVYEKTWKFLCFAGYVALLLGAPAVMDYSLASRTMMFDVIGNQWDRKIIDDCGLDAEKLPQLQPSGTMIGTIDRQVATHLGLNPSTAIVCGGHDQVCCALGAGILQSGVAMNSMGTTDSIVCVNNAFTSGMQQITSNIPCGAYPISGLYANHSFVLSTGTVLQWFKENFCQRKEYSFRELDSMAAQRLGPTGLFFMPHFSGSGTPYLDSNSKGALMGLTLDTGWAEIYKAILEGNNYEIKLNICNMERAGIMIDTVRCIGGAAKSDIYLQIKANILDKPVVKLVLEEAGCLGAALLAGVGCGIITNIRDTIGDFVCEEKVFLPQPDYSGAYQEHFEKYRMIYGFIHEIYTPYEKEKSLC